jgi:hypothetical protein
MSSYVGSFDFKNGLFPVRFRHNDGMTAIAAMLTPYGFIIGADGLRKDTFDNSVVADAAQKIFPIESGNVTLAFAWAGATTLAFPSGRIFDLIGATRQFFSQPEMLAGKSFADIVLLFREFLRMAFIAYAEPLPQAFFNTSIGRVLFLSYFDGQPCQAEVSVECGGNGRLQPKVVAVNCPANPQYIVFSGSQKMYAQFAGNSGISMPNTREAAIALIRDYIQLCIDNRSTDPECVGIGGKIHVGILNSEKFDWVEAPLQAQNRTS